MLQPKKWEFGHHLLILVSLQTCMTFFLEWKLKDNIFQTAGNQTFWLQLTSIEWTKEKISQNTFFCVLQKKEIHTGSEKLEG